MTDILGISAFYHDSAACLIRDGEILSAVEEERFTRVKHDHSFPDRAISYILHEYDLSGQDLDYVSYYEKPFVKFSRILDSFFQFAPRGFRAFLKAIPLWIKKKLWIKERIRTELDYSGEILFPEHHRSHAASAFYASPFEEAAFLTLDAVGERSTTSFGIGRENHLQVMKELHFPHSIGLLYSAFTYYTGFRVNSGEYKVMGLAPYGEPVYTDKIYEHLIDVKEDGSFRLNMDYFQYPYGLRMTNEHFHELFEGAPREPESPLGQKQMDLAASIQQVTEDLILKIAEHVREEARMEQLCLAGGVALNCVANGKLLRSDMFEDLWIQPAAGDAGGALGAALYTWYDYLGHERNVEGNSDAQKGSLLGPSFSSDEIRETLRSFDANWDHLSKEDTIEQAADLINDQKVIGWFQGRMEFGPRALGNRSILGDARSHEMQQTINKKIKFRERFRPFAPSVLAEATEQYFDMERDSPYMILVAQVADDVKRDLTPDEKQLRGMEKAEVVRSDIPAVTHVDGSSRLQTVHRETNPKYHELLKTMHEKYDCPVVINTSMNLRGEPIVCTPEDAYRCFMRSDMDTLFVGNFKLDKEKQPPLDEDKHWREEIPLD